MNLLKQAARALFPMTPVVDDIRASTGALSEVGDLIEALPQRLNAYERRIREQCARTALEAVGTWSNEDLQIVAQRTAEEIVRSILAEPGTRSCRTCGMPMARADDHDGPDNSLRRIWYCAICNHRTHAMWMKEG